MKVLMEFNFDNPDDKTDFDHYHNAMNYYLALNDVREAFRQKRKYGDNSEEVNAFLDKFFEEFWQIMNDHGIGDLL